MFQQTQQIIRTTSPVSAAWMATSSTPTSAAVVSATPLSISKLNNNDLESELRKLVHQERRLLHVILLHIKEVDNRKLYLKKAYPSLFEYLTKEHGYSAGSAMRRIEAARLLRDVPQMAAKIQSGAINLSQITEITRAVKEKQKELQKNFSTESKQDLQKTAAFVSRQEKENLVLKVAGLSLSETQKLVSLELNIKPKDTSLASVIEVLMDQFLAKRDMSAKTNKTSNHQLTHAAKLLSTQAAKLLSSQMNLATELSHSSKVKAENKHYVSKLETQKNESPAIETKSNKTVTAKAKSDILKRDRCCQYVDVKTNKKCESTYRLEVDHRQSRWAGGNHQQGNLQVLCKSHNNLKYKLESGRK